MPSEMATTGLDETMGSAIDNMSASPTAGTPLSSAGSSVSQTENARNVLDPSAESTDGLPSPHLKRPRSPLSESERVTRRRQDSQSTAPNNAAEASHQVIPGYLDSKNKKFFPLELRQMIWQFAMPDPVVIVLGHENPKAVLRSTRPNLLRVCRESRAEALKRYEILCGGVYRKTLYIDYERDEIHILNFSERRSVQMVAEKAQRLIIPKEMMDSINWRLQACQNDAMPDFTEQDDADLHCFKMVPHFYHELIAFPCAREITWVVDDDDSLFLDLMTLEALSDRIEYDQFRKETVAELSLLLGYRCTLPVHGTTNPVALERQNLLIWYRTAEDWQLEYARRVMYEKKEFIYRLIDSLARDKFRTDPAVNHINVVRPSLAVIYPGKGVEFDVQASYELISRGRSVSSSANPEVVPPEVDLRYPDGHEMAQVTEHDLKRCEWLSFPYHDEPGVFPLDFVRGRRPH